MVIFKLKNGGEFPFYLYINTIKANYYVVKESVYYQPILGTVYDKLVVKCSLTESERWDKAFM